MSETEPKKNWFMRHEVTGVILAVIVIGVIGAAAGGGNKTQNTGSSNQGGSQQASQPKQEKPKFDVKAFYDQVQTGQTKEQVVQLAGKEPDNCSENEIAGYGKTEVCNWNGSFSDGAFVSISFKDNAVNLKNKTGF